MKKTLKKYFKVWWISSKNSFMSVLNNRLGSSFFLVGKLLRFFIYLFFINILVKGTNTLAGYNLDQTIFFYLTFNLIDIVSQFLFRGVYRFRLKIIDGSFDLVLSKPIDSLFVSLFDSADLLDLVTIPPLIIFMFIVGSKLHPSILSVFLFIFLVFNSLLISAAFYIVVLSLGIVTLEVDHTVMIYRDLSNLGKFPIDIYKEPLKGFLTFIIPIGTMMTVPAKSLMNLVSLWGILLSFLLGGIFLLISISFWKYALTKYSSASS
jgi:ABC-2 type transport system permease protein